MQYDKRRYSRIIEPAKSSLIKQKLCHSLVQNVILFKIETKVFYKRRSKELQRYYIR